jgi:hypothetical protein
MLDKKSQERVQYTKAEGCRDRIAGKIAGRISPPRPIFARQSYLLMESLFIESPLSGLTLMMWIEFLSE